MASVAVLDAQHPFTGCREFYHVTTFTADGARLPAATFVVAANKTKYITSGLRRIKEHVDSVGAATGRQCSLRIVVLDDDIKGGFVLHCVARLYHSQY